MANKCKTKAAYTFTEGDQGPRIGGKFTDENGAFDLTGYTVQMAINRDGNYGDNLIKTASVNDPTTGEFFFTWETTDLVCGMGQEVLIKLVNASDEAISYQRFYIDVLRGIS